MLGLFPVLLVSSQPPACRVRSMRNHGANARLFGLSYQVILGFISLEGCGEIVRNMDGVEGSTMRQADFKEDPISNQQQQRRHENSQ